MNVSELLMLHVLLIGVTLVVVARFLINYNLFHWSSAGFWAWCAFVLYFVIPPLYALLQQDTNDYERDLSYTGGTERGLWILWISLVGIIVFFIFYLRAKPHTPSWHLADSSSIQRPSLVPMVVLFFFVVGMYSLLFTRAALLTTERETAIERGRFVGEVTGYEAGAYNFMFIPILFALLSKEKINRVFGFLLAAAFIGIGALDPWARFSVVSMALAVLLVFLTQKQKKWPHPILIALVMFIALVLNARGHVRFNDESSFWDIVESIPDRTDQTFTAGDTLSTFYVTSYVSDTEVGFDYGIPLINYTMSGYLPSSFFPGKYWLIEWLQTQQGTPNQLITKRLYGAKSSLLGSFYGHAGFVGIVFFMAIAGLLSRKLDGMLQLEAPTLIRATGISFMSMLWMVWNSSDTWGLVTLGTIAMPVIFIWLVSLKKDGLTGSRYGTHTHLRRRVW
jgi:hypothetical protein